MQLSMVLVPDSIHHTESGHLFHFADKYRSFLQYELQQLQVSVGSWSDHFHAKKRQKTCCGSQLIQTECLRFVLEVLNMMHWLNIRANQAIIDTKIGLFLFLSSFYNCRRIAIVVCIQALEKDSCWGNTLNSDRSNRLCAEFSFLFFVFAC